MAHLFITVMLLLVVGQAIAGRAFYLALRSDAESPGYVFAAPLAALYYGASIFEGAFAVLLSAYT